MYFTWKLDHGTPLLHTLEYSPFLTRPKPRYWIVHMVFMTWPLPASLIPFPAEGTLGFTLSLPNWTQSDVQFHDFTQAAPLPRMAPPSRATFLLSFTQFPSLHIPVEHILQAAHPLESLPESSNWPIPLYLYISIFIYPFVVHVMHSCACFT